MKIEVYSPTIRRKEMDAVLTAMVEDKIGPGERARLLIRTAKEFLCFDYALSLRGPAGALYLALKALDLEDGRGVLVSALSPDYYIRVIRELRLKPVYCDVSSALPCINRETVERALGENTGGEKPAAGCILLHHTLGFQPDTASIAELGLPVIEDISQSYGSFSADKPGDDVPDGEPEAGASGNFRTQKERIQGVFTILGLEERDMLTSGGGALLYAMNRRDASVLRNYGELPSECCLPDINAALAAVQFKETGRNFEKRKEIARIYTQASLHTRHKRFIPLDEGRYNNYAFPLVLETGLKDVMNYARKKEIIVESAFEHTPAGQGLSDPSLCPEAYSLSLRTVLFPLYPRLRSQDAERVSKLIRTLP
ncbi:MAG: DegT/DnrJ/EryC1/StrS family aminotransferase [Treponema sp.]|jgi:dTDP-4-amino-4,6-dideoxygalactose transaminase|nr:DegT/DnrJ/EryC1/StrS family aminotransferase [Treponema sp.]